MDGTRAIKGPPEPSTSESGHGVVRITFILSLLVTSRFAIEPSRSRSYPFHDGTFTVTQCGRICFKGRKVNLSHVFAGQNVGVTQVGERIWLVTFMRYDLGYFDDETCRLEPIENPFTPKVLPMPSGRNELSPM